LMMDHSSRNRKLIFGLMFAMIGMRLLIFALDVSGIIAWGTSLGVSVLSWMLPVGMPVAMISVMLLLGRKKMAANSQMPQARIVPPFSTNSFIIALTSNLSSSISSHSTPLPRRNTLTECLFSIAFTPYLKAFHASSGSSVEITRPIFMLLSSFASSMMKHNAFRLGRLLRECLTLARERPCQTPGLTG